MVFSVQPLTVDDPIWLEHSWHFLAAFLAVFLEAGFLAAFLTARLFISIDWLSKEPNGFLSCDVVTRAVSFQVTAATASA